MQRPTWPSLLVEPPNSRENWTDPWIGDDTLLLKEWRWRELEQEWYFECLFIVWEEEEEEEEEGISMRQRMLGGVPKRSTPRSHAFDTSKTTIYAFAIWSSFWSFSEFSRGRKRGIGRSIRTVEWSLPDWWGVWPTCTCNPSCQFQPNPTQPICKSLD